MSSLNASIRADPQNRRTCPAKEEGPAGSGPGRRERPWAPAGRARVCPQKPLHQGVRGSGSSSAGHLCSLPRSGSDPEAGDGTQEALSTTFDPRTGAEKVAARSCGLRGRPVSSAPQSGTCPQLRPLTLSELSLAPTGAGRVWPHPTEVVDGAQLLPKPESTRGPQNPHALGRCVFLSAGWFAVICPLRVPRRWPALAQACFWPALRA